MSPLRTTARRLGALAARMASWPSTAAGRLLSLGLAFVLVNVVLLAPQWGAPGMVPFHWVAGEAVLLVLLFAALPRRGWSLASALLASVAVVAVGLVGLGDATTRMSLSRPLNLYLDFRLLSAVVHLLTGTLSAWTAVLVGLMAGVGVVGLVAVLGHLLAPPRNVRPVLWDSRSATLGFALVGGLALGIRTPDTGPDIGMPAVRLVSEQVRFARALLEERDAFGEELRGTPEFGDRGGLLTTLRGRDVVLAFVESYGTTALDDDRYAPVVRPRLEDMERRLADAGLHLVTGALVAPSQGGQSWLGHASMLSGLWLHNQMRYDLLLASGRPTLIDDFKAAGYRTAALMPAITMAWPEGALFGYDVIYAFADIGYQGPPLNWVTMPDQFTWSFFEHTVRRTDDPRPLFAELGLISSHAPWTPILPVLEDWDAVGDGSIFEPWRDAGERPEDLWRDADRVREHFALSVEYAIHAAAAYAERYVDDQVLLIVLGDHQPAPLITGDGAPRTVPVHVISGDPELLRPFSDWGFRDGAFPDPAVVAPGMDRFRAWFIDAFSDPKGGMVHPGGIASGG